MCIPAVYILADLQGHLIICVIIKRFHHASPGCDLRRNIGCWHTYTGRLMCQFILYGFSIKIKPSIWVLFREITIAYYEWCHVNRCAVSGSVVVFVSLNAENGSRMLMKSQICYEINSSEFYLSAWNQIAANQMHHLFVESPHRHISILLEDNNKGFPVYCIKQYVISADKITRNWNVDIVYVLITSWYTLLNNAAST